MLIKQSAEKQYIQYIQLMYGLRGILPKLFDFLTNLSLCSTKFYKKIVIFLIFPFNASLNSQSIEKNNIQ